MRTSFAVMCNTMCGMCMCSMSWKVCAKMANVGYHEAKK